MTNPALTIDILNLEYNAWPTTTRNQFDQRFGQHIYNKYDFKTETSYVLEDLSEAYTDIATELMAINPYY